MSDNKKTEESQVMIDNTTFASAGRVMYVGQSTTGPGVEHARTYYHQYKDAHNIDLRSFTELLTALVLFDRLLWNGSSMVQEDDAMPIQHFWTEEGFLFDECWLYDWFPVFRHANVVEQIYRRGEADRLHRIRELAIRWVITRLRERQYNLPNGFRIPLAYQDPDYVDRPFFERILKKEAVDIREEELQIAMFLARGIFYQEEAFWGNGISYLPHSYRGVLMSDPELITLTLLSRIHPFLANEPITAADIMRDLDNVIGSELQKTLRIPDLAPGLAIGGAFFRRYRNEPIEAFREVLRFRETAEGKSIRNQMRNLISVGRLSHDLVLAEQLEGIRLSLLNVERETLGHATADDTKVMWLKQLGGKMTLVLQPLWWTLPDRVRETVTKVLYKEPKKTGFQLIFSYYFPRESG